MSNTPPPPAGYQVPPPSSGKPARPGTVSLSSTLLYLMFVIGLVSAGLAFYQATFYDPDTIARIYEDAGAASDFAKNQADSESVGLYVGAGVGAVFTLIYLLLGIFVGKGQQWARVTTWVLGGLGLCCGIVGLAGTAFTGTLLRMAGESADIDLAKAQEEIVALLPEWLPMVQLGLGIVSLVAGLIVIIALALPPSHPYFRKPEPEWVPPTYPTP